MQAQVSIFLPSSTSAAAAVGVDTQASDFQQQQEQEQKQEQQQQQLTAGEFPGDLFQSAVEWIESGKLTDEDIKQSLSELEDAVCSNDPLYDMNKSQNFVYITAENVHHLSPGDIIGWRYYSLPHDGVLENIEMNEEDPRLQPVKLTIIHYCRKPPRFRIQRETYTMDFRKSYWVTLFPPAACYPREEVLHRARSRLNEEEHELIFNSAKNFAHWCKLQSTGNRPKSSVALRLHSSDYMHEIKVADHLEINLGPCGLHGEVTEVVDGEPSPSHSLVTLLISRKTKNLDCLHQASIQTHDFPASQSVKKVSVTTSRRSNEDISYYASLYTGICFREAESSLNFALRVTDPSAILSSSSTDPRGEQVNLHDLEFGDVIFFNGLYRVVISNCQRENQLHLTTLQYDRLQIDGKPDPLQVKVLISKVEPDDNVRLCVHNDPREDCELYTADKKLIQARNVLVQSSDVIKKGSAISFKKNGIWQRAIVVDGLKDNSLQVIHYTLKVQKAGCLSGPMQVCQTTLRDVTALIKDKKLHSIQFKQEILKSPEVVVQRARSRLGERQYDLLHNSSRDFVRWCCVGHPSNREQCEIPIESVQQLVEFQRGHIKFPRIAYSHHALLRQCELLQDDTSVAEVVMYENNSAFKTVRLETRKLDGNHRIRRVVYEWNSDNDNVETESESVSSRVTMMTKKCERMQDRSVLHTIDGKKAGSRLRSQDFCRWLMTTYTPDLSDLNKLFGKQLDELKKSVNSILSKESGSSGEEGVEVVYGTDLRVGDHIVLHEKRNDKERDVHCVLLEVRDLEEEKVVVRFATFDSPSKTEKMGVKKLRAFLTIDNLGSVVKVVHSVSADWEAVDKKFSDCEGAENYHFLKHNCEHFVNFLLYGTRTCLQFHKVAAVTLSYSPKVATALKIARRLLPFVAEGVETFAGVVGIGLLGLSLLYDCTQRKRRAGDWKQRLVKVVCLSGAAVSLSAWTGVSVVGLVLLAVSLLCFEQLPRLAQIVRRFTSP